MNPPTAPKIKIVPAIIIACIASSLSTMLGIGGGVVMVPLLTLFAAMPIKRTAGTSLAVILLVVSIGVIAQEIRAPGDIRWEISACLAAGAVAGSFAGRWLNEKIPERIFRYIFCAVLIVVSIRLFGLVSFSTTLLGNGPASLGLGEIAYLVAMGLVAGIVSALFGLGGGIVAVPALALGFAYFQDNFISTRATSLGMILPTSLVGTVLHYRAGNVDLKVVGLMAPFAVVFAVLGVLVAYAVPTDALKVIFATLLAVAAVRLAISNPKKKSSRKS